MGLAKSIRETVKHQLRLILSQTRIDKHAPLEETKEKLKKLSAKNKTEIRERIQRNHSSIGEFTIDLCFVIQTVWANRRGSPLSTVDDVVVSHRKLVGTKLHIKSENEGIDLTETVFQSDLPDDANLKEVWTQK